MASANIISANMQEIIPRVFTETVTKLPTGSAYKYRDKNNEWQIATWQEVYNRAIQIASALIEMGIQTQDKIGLFADNRFEWAQLDMGIQFAGAVSVPRGTDSTIDEIKYILDHSDSVIVIVENKKVYDKIINNLKDLKKITQVIAIDTNGIDSDKILSFDQLIKKGEDLLTENAQAHKEKIKERLESIEPDDAYTIIYTSGTTGLPKGVQQTHRNETHQMRVLPRAVNLQFGKETMLSILPVWHTFERMVEYITISSGGLTVYTNIRDLKIDIREQKPTFMASAPRLWEQIYLGIFNSVQSGSAVKRGLFAIAYKLSQWYGSAVRFLSGNELKVSPPNPILSAFRAVFYLLTVLIIFPFYKLFDFIVLRKVRAATGGRMRGTLSGGGALPGHVDIFFNNIGINVLEGYGMTESGPVISVRTFDKKVIGSVGPIVDEAEVEIRDFNGKILPRGQKGVIWTKGPHVMKGYYKMPEQTAKTIVDGWLNTGDMGFISFNNTLTIAGRAKETIVLLGGENVEPVPIENKLLESDYIGQVMVTGQDQKYLSCLIYPDMEKMAEFMGNNETLDIDELAKDDTVIDLLRNEIKRMVSASTGYKSFEKVVDFRLIPKPFEVGDELTNLGKMKRHVITDKYQSLIADIYKAKK